MLDIIYNSLNFIIVLLAMIYGGICIVSMVKRTYNNVVNIKVRIMFASILFALFVFEMIPAVMLSKSIKSEIFCAILWAINIVTGILCLKTRKTDSPNVEIDKLRIDLDFPYDDNVIDVDYIEVQDIDDEK